MPSDALQIICDAIEENDLQIQALQQAIQKAMRVGELLQQAKENLQNGGGPPGSGPPETGGTAAGRTR